MNDRAYLGKDTKYQFDNPDQVALDLIPNPREAYYTARFTVPEFTSLCIAGDTLIDVACDETKFPNGIPIKDLVGTEGLVFTYDEKTSEPKVRRYFDVRKTRAAATTIRINFRKRLPQSKGSRYSDKVSFVEVTPDHMLLVRRGFKGHEWVQAADLKPGDRFIADQRSNDLIRETSRHRLIAEYLEGRKLTPTEDAHHKNHCHFDNRPENIEVLTDSEHFRHHQTVHYGYDNLINIDQLVVEYNQVKNLSELARKYGCDQSTLASRLQGRVNFRSISDVLKNRNAALNKEAIDECIKLYETGYTSYEIAEYFGLHITAVTSRLRRAGVAIRESNFSRKHRRSLDLPELNHRVENIEPGKVQDVYNMEVEDTHCFFGNSIVLHNCPQTGQPDFAVMIIDYQPCDWLLESKALKLWMFAHRNHGAYHEDVTVGIGQRFFHEVKPYWARIAGFFMPRGGIPIDIVWQEGIQRVEAPVLDLNAVKPYLGRI